MSEVDVLERPDPEEVDELEASWNIPATKIEYYEPQPVSIDRETLIRLNFVNTDAFLNTCIPEELELPIPELHRTVFQKMVNSTSRLCFALPRGTAKTTLMKLAAIFHLLYSDHSYVIYLSSTHPNASNYTRDIIATMQTPNFEAVYGKLDFIVEQQSHGFYMFWMNKYLFNIDGTITEKRVKVTIQSRGAQQSVRGLNVNNKRPSLLLVDDVEKKEDMVLESNYKKLKTWFYGTMLKALDKRRQKVIQIGNLVSQVCILRDHLESSRWETMCFGILNNKGESIWPELWPLEEIFDDYLLYLEENQLATWFAEMMNMPMPPSGGLIRLDQIKYATAMSPEEGGYEYAFITVDLAYSQKTWANATAVAVHVWTGQNWVIADTIYQKGLQPIDLLMMLHKLAKAWGVNYIGIESAAYQAALLPVYAYVCKLHNINNLKFVPCPARNSKVERLVAWANLIKNGLYKIAMNQQRVTSQLITFDPTAANNDDDMIDACAHGPHVIKQYLGEISRGYLAEQFTSNNATDGKTLQAPRPTL